MPRLYREDTGQLIGDFGEEDFLRIRAYLVEESDEDRDYYIDQATVDYLESRGLSREAAAVLRIAIDGGTEVLWEKD